MNAETSLFPIRGRIDLEGRLLEADPPLAMLHVQTGGAPGGMIAIPQLAALVRLVGRLQVAVSRTVSTASDGSDLSLLVHARPDGDHIAVEIVDWESRPAVVPLHPAGTSRSRDFARAGADFTWVVDAQLALVELSQEAAAATGSTAEAMRGLPITRLFSLFEDADEATPMLDAFARKRGFTGQKARLRGSDLGPLLLSGMPLFDEEGHFAGYRGRAVRVVDEEDAQEEVPSHPTIEDSLGTEIGEVLRDPLDRIIANADVIREQAEGPLRRGYADYAADIAAAGRHLLSLVDDLIELQTIERADFRPTIEQIDLCVIARRAAGLLTAKAASRNVVIEPPEEGGSLPASGEFRRVLQILVNLLGNAVRYSPAGGTIWLRAHREDGRAVLIVADQGPGIPPVSQDRIFEKFERLDRSDPSGSGLGLYISRRLARAMGGDLTVDTAPGQGARFVLTLPARSG